MKTMFNPVKWKPYFLMLLLPLLIGGTLHAQTFNITQSGNFYKIEINPSLIGKGDLVYFRYSDGVHQKNNCKN